MHASQALLFHHPSDTDGGQNFIITPAWEISAYEAIWIKYKTVKRVADIFRKHRHILPSQAAHKEGITQETIQKTRNQLREICPFSSYSALFYRDFEYPKQLCDAKHPSEILYYKGALDLLSSRCVSVVGSRKPSEAGRQRARKITKVLVQNGFTPMSGVAEGIDTEAHQAAIEAGGKTVGVIGTALNDAYPKTNQNLQQHIAEKHLLISQVPFYLASQRDWRSNRIFFPERNKTMSALSVATIVIEASDTSGTLFQAQAAIQQKRPLFILNSCFEQGLQWPNQYRQKGAMKVRDGEEIVHILQKSSL